MTKCNSGVRSMANCGPDCLHNCSHLYWVCDTHHVEGGWGASIKILEEREARHVVDVLREENKMTKTKEVIWEYDAGWRRDGQIQSHGTWTTNVNYALQQLNALVIPHCFYEDTDCTNELPFLIRRRQAGKPQEYTAQELEATIREGIDD